MSYSEEEYQYRDFIGGKIEAVTGDLSDDGSGKGIWSLDTKSLEKLYSSLWHTDPNNDWKMVLNSRK